MIRRAFIKKSLSLAVIYLLIFHMPAAAIKRPITANDLWNLKRIGSYRLSPSGHKAAVVVTEYDIEENKGQGDIWLVNTDGSGSRRFTTGETTESDPVWSQRGNKIAFTASRNSGKPQLQIISTEGGEATEVTDMPLGVSDPRWLPCGRKMIFVSPVIPGFGGDPDSIRAELTRREKSKVSAKVTEDRFYRYWDHWLTDGYINHLFMIDLETKKVTDLMPGWDRLTGSRGGIEYDISPDGKEIAFTSLRSGPPYDSLESDIYLLDIADPGICRNLTADNPADDFSPYYTPDGKYILYGRQKIIGFYGDRVRLVRYNRMTEEKRLLTESFDRSPSDWVVDKKGKKIFFHAEDRAMVSLFSVGIDGGKISEIYRGGSNRSIDLLPDGSLIFIHQSNSQPACLCIVDKNGGNFKKLTSFNDALLDSIEMGRFEDVWFKGADDEDVQMFILYPPGFDSGRKWPLLMLVHGGPHGTFGDVFHPRWNTQVFAAPGYVTAMVNFHGSSGFGQEFTDAITGEHGRKPFIDVMNAVDLIIGRGFIDEERMALAGGSYGGYLASWVGTQTDRFACLINHAGVFDLCAQFGSDITSGRSRAYGGTVWDDIEDVIKWSPAHNMKDYSTPTLIIHGEKDYRVPVGNGLEAYGILKAKGVPSRFVYFPDENHWVLTPQNSIFWYGEFHAWLDRWISAGPKAGMQSRKPGRSS
ncbi:MAG: S9 family peptidase [Candidatus Krumholzibacteriota bacterium]|nr:S9 family peptidase [Candidatus Krumholzibacteriota bacterium]